MPVKLHKIKGTITRRKVQLQSTEKITIFTEIQKTLVLNIIPVVLQSKEHLIENNSRLKSIHKCPFGQF